MTIESVFICDICNVKNFRVDGALLFYGLQTSTHYLHCFGATNDPEPAGTLRNEQICDVCFKELEIVKDKLRQEALLKCDKVTADFEKAYPKARQEFKNMIR